MAHAAAFAQNVERFLHLKDAPPTLVTRSLRSAELAVTETRDDHPMPRLSDSMPSEDAYLVGLKFRDFADCECWERGRCVIKNDIRAGATYLYDLKRDPRYVIDKPFHSLLFYLPRSALDDMARQGGVRGIGELAYQPGVGHDDTTIRHLGASFLAALRQPDEANQLFIDHMMLALTAHVATTYGGLRSAAEPARRPCPMAGQACLRTAGIRSPRKALTGQDRSRIRSLRQSFFACVSHLHRPAAAPMAAAPARGHGQAIDDGARPAVAEIAISAGFANQSHFTRVFSSIVGISPGLWRREARGASESEI